MRRCACVPESTLRMADACATLTVPAHSLIRSSRQAGIPCRWLCCRLAGDGRRPCQRQVSKIGTGATRPKKLFSAPARPTYTSLNYAASIDGTPSSPEMGTNTGSLQRAIKHATCQEDVYVLVTQQITQSLVVKFPQAPFIIILWVTGGADTS